MREIRLSGLVGGAAQINAPSLPRSALEEALELGAYGSDYLQNLLEHRRALTPLIGELHLTRGAELLAIELPPPDCSRYQPAPATEPARTPHANALP